MVFNICNEYVICNNVKYEYCINCNNEIDFTSSYTHIQGIECNILDINIKEEDRECLGICGECCNKNYDDKFLKCKYLIIGNKIYDIDFMSVS